MADTDSVFTADPSEFQTIDWKDSTPAHDAGFDFVMPAVPSRRSVSSQDLPRFSRTSLQ
jgi:hypothetical protein